MELMMLGCSAVALVVDDRVGTVGVDFGSFIRKLEVLSEDLRDGR
jgi:hypothetical protein